MWVRNPPRAPFLIFIKEGDFVMEYYNKFNDAFDENDYSDTDVYNLYSEENEMEYFDENY